MDYEFLYHELNHRRKIEIDLHRKSISAASVLYDKLIEISNQSQYEDNRITEIRKLCGDTCAALETAYQELLNTDIIIEEMCIYDD